ncbi:MAG: DNA recombination protein RmuC [Candidatus Sungiibacteriota bacterium]
MNTEFFILAILVIAGFGGLFWFLGRKKNAPQDMSSINQMMLMMQNHINDMARSLDTRMAESNTMVQRQFGASTEVMQNVADKNTRVMQDQSQSMQEQAHKNTRMVAEIAEKLTRVEESVRQVISVGDQVKNLQDILKNPKQRGILGEYYLETVLKNVLPPGSYQMQYAFADGVIVDAAVFVDKRIIPIDSKFSLENYNRILEARDPAEKKRYEAAFIADLKLRIDETSKYVQPHADTMDFAFMFIPSEAVYYDLLINKVGAVEDETRNLLYYAGQKRVIVVSPTSFLAYLQTVLQGLRNQKISDTAREIVKQVEDLRRHLVSYDVYFKKIGTHLTTTVSMYNNAGKEFGKVDKDIGRITGERTGVESVMIARPENEEE